jgi:DNA-binding transcriptional LysR family regulator
MTLLDSMHIFARVAELSSFTRAADALGLPKASVSTAVQQLENQLGTRLLQRTTRKVQLTHDGQAYYERCKDMLADIDGLQGMFQQQGSNAVRGRVRIDMSTGMARHAVIPRLPELLLQHPQLELEISSTERRVDVIREGFDCVVRAGSVVDAGLIGCPIGHMPMVNCASPGYLAIHGIPAAPADLVTHRLVHYVPTLGARPDGFDYRVGDTTITQPMQGSVTVNNADAYTAACVAGLGLIQVPEVAGLQGQPAATDAALRQPAQFASTGAGGDGLADAGHSAVPGATAPPVRDVKPGSPAAAAQTPHTSPGRPGWPWRPCSSPSPGAGPAAAS